jgi:peptidoglycan/xylan/chitin deacetylase (PgdA/CDA1 family)
MLFYGLCGNAFKDTSEVEKETGKTLTLLTDDEGRPVDDCIAAVLGGTDGYLRLLKRYPGVFYLTPGWAENWRELIHKMELTRGIKKDDLSMLKLLFELTGYRKALKLDTGLGDQECFERQVDDFVREFNFEKATLEKEFITLDAVDHSYERAKKA